MIDDEGFRKFLKRKGKALHTVERLVELVQGFQTYLQRQGHDKSIEQADHSNLEAYIAWIEGEQKESAKTPLWAISLYFEFVENQKMLRVADTLREQRTKKQRKPFLLKKFTGVNPDHIKTLAQHKIRNLEQMLQEGRTPQQRKALAKQTSIPLQAIADLVSLSDLARLPGVKGIRARLYIDMGINSIPKLAKWNPDELRIKAIEFIEKTGFEGIAPLPKEATHSIGTAKKLPKIVEW